MMEKRYNKRMKSGVSMLFKPPHAWQRHCCSIRSSNVVIVIDKVRCGGANVGGVSVRTEKENDICEEKSQRAISC